MKDELLVGFGIVLIVAIYFWFTTESAQAVLTSLIQTT